MTVFSYCSFLHKVNNMSALGCCARLKHGSSQKLLTGFLLNLGSADEFNFCPYRSNVTRTLH